MTCSAEFLLINGNGIVTNVFETTCVIISDEVFGFADGSTVSNPFSTTSSVIQEIDFSSATSLKTIGSYAFYQCTKVQTFDLSKCSNLETIGICAFRECSSAISIILPEDSKLTVLPGGCFSNCTSLKSFNVPKTIVTIDVDNPGNYGVFMTTSSLREVTFSKNSSCKQILSKAFMYSAIEKIVLPSPLQEISAFSFRKCDNLTSIDVENGNEYYSSEEGILMDKDLKLIYFPNSHKLITKDRKLDLPGYFKGGLSDSCFAGIELSNLNIPNNYTTFDIRCFAYSNIQKVTIPASVQTIPELLFASAYSLYNVTFMNKPDSLTRKMFSQCASLREFYIPASVISIADNCFEQCTSVENVYVPKSVTTFGSSVFIACNSKLQLIIEEDSPLNFVENCLYQEHQTILKYYLGSEENVSVLSTTTKIEGAAFQNKMIKTITFENVNNITEIGEYAFAGCTKLERIDLPNKLNKINKCTFYQASSLKTITIPESVKIIDEMAFYQCTSLNSVYFHNPTETSNFKLSLKSEDNSALININKQAFYNCCSLQTFELPDSVSSIGEEAFSYFPMLTFRLPNNLTKIGIKAFSESLIQEFDYDNEEIQLVIIHTQSFESMNALTTFTLPDSVLKIENNAFHLCDSLTTVKLNQNLAQIEDRAFNQLPSLEKVEIPPNEYLDNLTYLTFYDCPKLKEIQFDDETTNFKFIDSILYNKQQTEIIRYLKANNIDHIEIPSSVKYIGQYAFSECPSIRSVHFSGDNQLEEIRLGAFQNCYSLKTINFPSSLKELGTDAFTNCSIDIIYLLYTNITDLKSNTFSGNKHCKQIVLPIFLQNVSSNTFSNTYSKVYVFYHGEHIIEEEAGLSTTAKVYCYDRYNSSIFLGLPVQKEFLCPTLNQQQSFNILNFRFLVFISILYSYK